MAEHVLAMDDPQGFLDGLVDAVTNRLPRQIIASSLTVVRQKSLADRLFGRAGSISSISLVTRGLAMELNCSTGGRYTAETRRVVRGIVISRRSMELREWLESLALRVAVLAGDTVQPTDPSAAADALRKLGISVSGSSVEVGDETVLADLRALPFKVRSTLPVPAAASVDRIVSLLLDTLPRVTGDLEANAFAERTATVYLPDTLRAYLALPTDFARSHVYSDGSTPDSALLAQLVVLERAVSRMHEAAVRGDAEALLLNGRFLNDRFPDANG